MKFLNWIKNIFIIVLSCIFMIIFMLYICWKLFRLFFYNLLLFPFRVFCYLLYMYSKKVKRELKRNDRTWNYNNFNVHKDGWLSKYWRRAHLYDSPPLTYNDFMKAFFKFNNGGIVYRIWEAYVEAMEIELEKQIEATVILNKMDKKETTYEEIKANNVEVDFTEVLKALIYELYYVDSIPLWYWFVDEENLERFVLDNAYLDLYSDISETNDMFYGFDEHEVTDAGGLDMDIGQRVSWPEEWFQDLLDEGFIRGFSYPHKSIFYKKLYYRDIYWPISSQRQRFIIFFWGNVLYYFHYCRWFWLNYFNCVKRVLFWRANVQRMDFNFNGVVLYEGLFKVLRLWDFSYLNFFSLSLLRVKLYNFFNYFNLSFDVFYKYSICIYIGLSLNVLVKIIMNCLELVVMCVWSFYYYFIFLNFLFLLNSFERFKNEKFFEIIFYIHCFMLLEFKFKVKLIINSFKILYLYIVKK